MCIHPHPSGLAPVERHTNQGSGNFGMTCQGQRNNLNTKFVLESLGQQFHMTKNRFAIGGRTDSPTGNISSRARLQSEKIVFQVCMLLPPPVPVQDVNHRKPCMSFFPIGKAQETNEKLLLIRQYNKLGIYAQYALKARKKEEKRRTGIDKQAA